MDCNWSSRMLNELSAKSIQVWPNVYALQSVRNFSCDERDTKVKRVLVTLRNERSVFEINVSGSMTGIPIEFLSSSSSSSSSSSGGGGGGGSSSTARSV